MKFCLHTKIFPLNVENIEKKSFFQEKKQHFIELVPMVRWKASLTNSLKKFWRKDDFFYFLKMINIQFSDGLFFLIKFIRTRRKQLWQPVEISCQKAKLFRSLNFRKIWRRNISKNFLVKLFPWTRRRPFLQIGRQKYGRRSKTFHLRVRSFWTNYHYKYSLKVFQWTCKNKFRQPCWKFIARKPKKIAQCPEKIKTIRFLPWKLFPIKNFLWTRRMQYCKTHRIIFAGLPKTSL